MTATRALTRLVLRRPGFAAVILGLVGLVVWQARVHLGAWNSLREGRDALARHDPAAARPPLDRCLEVWPRSAEAHFLAARSARMCGDADAAAGHLDAAERAGYPSADIRFERAVLQAQSGEPGEPAGELYASAAGEGPRAVEAIEVLVRGCMADFRIPEAGELTARWVELAPDSVPAWTFRAEVLERLGHRSQAVEALRRLVGLDSTSRRARLSLARLLLDTRTDPDEAAGHLEWLTSSDPTDTEAQVQLGACREAQGRPDEAVAILDRVIAGSADPAALYYRGRLELNAGRPAAALPYLRRAADLDPSRVELLYTLFVCSQRAGTPEETRAAEDRWRRCEADRKRVGELARAIGVSPSDPDLRREMGELFLRNGMPAPGVRWLESALRLRPDHAPSRAVLARYYEQSGQPDRARGYATPPPP